MMKLTIAALVRNIHGCLSVDLLSPKWQRIVAASGKDPKLAGHCAIAAEALYDMLGGSQAGYMPYVCSYYYDVRGDRVFGKAPKGREQMTHWWLRGPMGSIRGKGKIIDPTATQYTAPFPYQYGRPVGFMSPTPPSKRARLLIDRVMARLGAENIARFRNNQISVFSKAGGEVVLSPATRRREAELASLNIKNRLPKKPAF